MRFILTILFAFALEVHFLPDRSIYQLSANQISLLEDHDDGENQTAPCTIVIFGATGDLTARKLLPAIYHLAHDGYLSDRLAVVGVARNGHTHEEFCQKMEHAIDQFARAPSRDPDFWNHFKNHIFYHQSDFGNDQGYEKLQEYLTKIDEELGTQGNRIYYLATQPSFFPIIIEKLHAHHLLYHPHHTNDKWSRVIIEKPFGNDLDTAKQLQEQLSKYLDESQVYRIDHYLGKEGVQNLLALRFENALFEPMWNHQYIDHVQITLSETIGIGSRAQFWEETGCLRDIFQNHLMQLLAIIAMDAPMDLQPASLHAEKIKVLNAIRAFPLSEIDDYVIRGQYGPGVIQGTHVPGYREEKGVNETSSMDTFIAAKLFIDHPRWKGVPFYIRGGKRLAKQTTEIAIVFKKSPLSLSQEPNILFIRIQPKAGIFLKMMSKVPGLNQKLLPVMFGYQQDHVFQTFSPEAYERLIYDCAKGNAHLFVEAEEHLAAWRLLAPVLEYWKMHAPQHFPNYPSGTWGPQSADQMLLQDGHKWQLLENEEAFGKGST